jgi:hypothetical protein
MQVQCLYLHIVTSKSRAIAGAAGDLFPRLFIDLVRILLDRKILAARRAAKGDGASADPKLDFFTARFAFHESLKKDRGRKPVSGDQEKSALRPHNAPLPAL